MLNLGSRAIPMARSILEQGSLTNQRGTRGGRTAVPQAYLSHCLNSLKGIISGTIILRLIEEDARSLDYSLLSYGARQQRFQDEMGLYDMAYSP